MTWLHASATDAITPMQADLAVMTGNVAQVFMDDREWDAVLIGVREALPDEGWLVIEARVPTAETGAIGRPTPCAAPAPAPASPPSVSSSPGSRSPT